MLTSPEIMMIVNNYIGVEAGNLLHFSHKSLAEFYPYYCDLNYDMGKFEGTKKDIFISILKRSNEREQAKILEGLLSYLPLSKFEYIDILTDEKIFENNKKEAYEKIVQIILRLDQSKGVVREDLITTNETVKRAIEDAKILIEKNGATSGVDRIHTALHGYLKQVCTESNIIASEDDSLTQIFSKLRANHPALRSLGVRQNEIEKIINAFSNVLDKLNPIRNHASLSHPNVQLLEEDEAMFVVNAAQTVLNYLNRKFK